VFECKKNGMKITLKEAVETFGSSSMKRYLSNFCSSCLKPVMNKKYKDTKGFYQCKKCSDADAKCGYSKAFEGLRDARHNGGCGETLCCIF